MRFDTATARRGQDLALHTPDPDTTAAGFNREPPLRILYFNSATAGAHTNISAGVLERDAARTGIELHITACRNGYLKINASQTKLENAPIHLGRDVYGIASLIIVYLHTFGIDAKTTGPFGRVHTNHALFAPADRYSA